MKRTPRRLIGMLIAVAALFAVPASAQALSLSGLAAAPASTQAGAHSNFHIHMDFSGGQVKDLTIGLPPGMVGDPNATPLCTVTQLNGDACPANTKVGSVTANATVTVVAIPLTLDVHGDLYNVTPQPGEPAHFGIVLRPVKGDLCNLLDGLGLSALCSAIPNILPPVILQSAVQLRPDFGLNTVINNIPNDTSGLPTTINSQDITLFGTAPGTGKPFMRNPTSCKQQTTTFSAVPYPGGGGNASGQASFTTTGCDSLDFSPSFSAEVGGPGHTANGVPTNAITAIDQDNDEAGLLQAHVFIPHDLAPNLNIFGNSCDPAAFQAGNCPTTSIVGSAIAASPLLSQPLAGNVMLVNSGSTFPNIGLDLKGQLHLLLQGSLALDSSVTFAGLPDIPIAHFQLAFGPDPGMLVANRDLCAPPAPVFHAEFQGYNGTSTAVDSAATVDGCGAGSGNVGGKCTKHKAKKKHKKRAAEAKKKHKKKSCKKKKRKKHRR
jgi:hypothetical protein